MDDRAHERMLEAFGLAPGDELADLVVALREAPTIEELPPALEARTLLAVRAAAGPLPRAERPRPRRQWLRVLAPVAVAAAVLLAVVLRPAGELEVEGTLAATRALPGATGDVEVRLLDIGREIEFRSDSLPILPKGAYYELWFVGPGDSRRAPNRISAGTFHPDEDGRSHVTFTAAVDPAKYPVIAVSREPGDGDPRRTGPDVLRLGR